MTTRLRIASVFAGASIVAGIIFMTGLFKLISTGHASAPNPFLEVNENPGVVPPASLEVRAENPTSPKVREQNNALTAALTALEKPLDEKDMTPLSEDFIAKVIPKAMKYERPGQYDLDQSGETFILNVSATLSYSESLQEHLRWGDGISPLLVWHHEGDSYRNILSTDAHVVALEPTVSNGEHDLVVCIGVCKGLAHDRVIQVYKYDGHLYQLTSYFQEKDIPGQFLE